MIVVNDNITIIHYIEIHNYQDILFDYNYSQAKGRGQVRFDLRTSDIKVLEGTIPKYVLYDLLEWLLDF